MTGNSGIDLRQIAQDCGIFDKKDASVIVENLEGLKNTYSSKELVSIYNYLLANSSEPEVIMYLIRCVDVYRDK